MFLASWAWLDRCRSQRIQMLNKQIVRMLSSFEVSILKAA